MASLKLGIIIEVEPDDPDSERGQRMLAEVAALRRNLNELFAAEVEYDQSLFNDIARCVGDLCQITRRARARLKNRGGAAPE